jgi:hypothetical protein
LGNFKPHEEKAKTASEKERDKTFRIEHCGRPIPAKNTDDGIRAVQGAQVIDPDSVRRYLDDKFGEDLKAVRSAMRKLAKAYNPSDLAHDAYPPYERFRPEIPAGMKGWGVRVCRDRADAAPRRMANSSQHPGRLGGLGHARKGYRSAWESIEAENPEMWSEFKSNDVDANHHA